MTISEKIAELEGIEMMLRGGAANIVAALGADLCASIADRVINSGKNADGQQFSPYSEKKVPAFWYTGRSLNASGEAKIKAAAKKKEGVSYREFRQFNNRPGAPKNFSFSNEMWRGFGVKNAQFESGKYILVIGGKTKVSSDRIEFTSSQEGRSIIEPDTQELNHLAAQLTNKILGRG